MSAYTRHSVDQWYNSCKKVYAKQENAEILYTLCAKNIFNNNQREVNIAVKETYAQPTSIE